MRTIDITEPHTLGADVALDRVLHMPDEPDPYVKRRKLIVDFLTHVIMLDLEAHGEPQIITITITASEVRFQTEEIDDTIWHRFQRGGAWWFVEPKIRAKLRELLK